MPCMTFSTLPNGDYNGLSTNCDCEFQSTSNHCSRHLAMFRVHDHIQYMAMFGTHYKYNVGCSTWFSRIAVPRVVLLHCCLCIMAFALWPLHCGPCIVALALWPLHHRLWYILLSSSLVVPRNKRCAVYIDRPLAPSSCTVLLHRPLAPSSCTVLLHR